MKVDKATAYVVFRLKTTVLLCDEIVEPTKPHHNYALIKLHDK